MISINAIWDAEPPATDEVIEGMKYARRIAIETGKGMIASHAITERIQRMNMKMELAKMEGRL